MVAMRAYVGWKSDREKLVSSGESLGMWLRVIGFISTLAGGLAIAAVLVGGDIVAVISGALLVFQGVILIVSASFVESLAASVGNIAMHVIEQPSGERNAAA